MAKEISANNNINVVKDVLPKSTVLKIGIPQYKVYKEIDPFDKK